MKDSYILSKGKVLITNFNKYGLKDIQGREYQDNIEEILITENVIEELENNQYDLNESIRINKKMLVRIMKIMFVHSLVQSLFQL